MVVKEMTVPAACRLVKSVSKACQLMTSGEDIVKRQQRRRGLWRFRRHAPAPAKPGAAMKINLQHQLKI